MKLRKIFIPICITIITVSCAKQGCTDADADNYNSSAEKDDGGCLYGIDMTFYMSDGRVDALTDAGIAPPISVSIGSPTITSKTVGTIDWENDSIYTEEPDCGAELPFVFNLRYVDYSKGTNTAVIKSEYGDGYSTNIALDLNLGEGDCLVRSF